MTIVQEAKFSIGQVVKHLSFGYLGVIVDVDPCFQLSDEWYRQMARSRPPKDRPWYHVLVDKAEHLTYVAERNLDTAKPAQRIEHPLIDSFFDHYENGRYLFRQNVH